MKHFRSLSEMHSENGLPEPEHPMLSLLKITPGLVLNFREFTCDFYMIGLKNIKAGHWLYGRTRFDHEKGSMVFWKPRQVIEINNLELEEGGYILLFHEDFLLGSALQREIGRHAFFDYEADEALHLAPKEEKIIVRLFESIDAEYNNNQDEFSRNIILVNIDSLLKYAERFYKRQFINRRELSGKTVSAFQRLLDDFIRQDKLMKEGLPSVSALAAELNMSPRYLSNALKLETGKTAQELIHIALISVAKNRLRESGDHISEIAYSLGFENMSYFSRLFRKEVGQPPKDFKKTLLN
ncbi:AraC family transcriptional regulator [Mucilaginibacter gossypii]|uniref:helix-turn-helix domain-containing protein n=1 Tax=Mucilaginibacter gossypii TaxID=551996 RepID=UPI000DCF4E1B|nr:MULTISPECIES: AraC family transcriptional regulator [Mucilaginibacter]QTE38368.1 AraC family transcriptional regulator [Mucilaginibacter gossypii]RAV52158.1 AraC family transcriptional regulator [Mucilaginibacter rubeus]